MNEPERIRHALETAETVAVVGCSPNPARASYAITRFLLEQ
jgi:predicted CoA-binding protein